MLVKSTKTHKYKHVILATLLAIHFIGLTKMSGSEVFWCDVKNANCDVGGR